MTAPTRPSHRADLDQVFREHYGRVLAWLIRASDDFGAAEEAQQRTIAELRA